MVDGGRASRILRIDFHVLGTQSPIVGDQRSRVSRDLKLICGAQSHVDLSLTLLAIRLGANRRHSTNFNSRDPYRSSYAKPADVFKASSQVQFFPKEAWNKQKCQKRQPGRDDEC
jgi:hypothetical protein